MVCDQLQDIGALVNTHPLVIELIYDLIGAYLGVSTLIFQSNPLSFFHQTCSMLILEEACLAKMTPIESHVAYLTIQ